MSKQSKAILMNVTVVGVLAYFYLAKGTQPLALIISGVTCLLVLNLTLAFSKPRA